MSFKMAAKAAPLFCREAALINRGEAAPLKTAHGSAEHSAPQAGTNLFLRPKAALFSFPKGKSFRPHHLFFKKRDGAAWRYQRKIVGGFDAFCSSGSQKAPPIPPLSSREALSPSQNPPSKKKGFTGEHGSPVKSRAARDAVPHCISAEMPRLSPWRFSLLDRSSGPFSFRAKREWGAGSTSPWEGKKRALLGAKSSLAALCAEILRPARLRGSISANGARYSPRTPNRSSPPAAEMPMTAGMLILHLRKRNRSSAPSAAAGRETPAAPP